MFFNWLIMTPVKDRFGLSTVVHWLNKVLTVGQKKSSSASVRSWIFFAEDDVFYAGCFESLGTESKRQSFAIRNSNALRAVKVRPKNLMLPSFLLI